MIRRKAPKAKTAGAKKTKKNSKPIVEVAVDNFFKKSGRTPVMAIAHLRKNNSHDLRFGISLVLLTAVLEVSVMIFLLTLINHGGARRNYAQAMVTMPASQVTAAPSAKTQSQMLADDNLEFKLSIPAGFGDWSYKVGYLKSPVDGDLADQYVRIYVPSVKGGKSNNLDERQKCIMTMVRYVQDEYSELKKGCEKDNRFYCDMLGAELGSNNGHIWTYQKGTGCPEKLEKQCGMADSIIKSFKFN